MKDLLLLLVVLSKLETETISGIVENKIRLYLIYCSIGIRKRGKGIILYPFLMPISRRSIRIKCIPLKKSIEILVND